MITQEAWNDLYNRWDTLQLKWFDRFFNPENDFAGDVLHDLLTQLQYEKKPLPTKEVDLMLFTLTKKIVPHGLPPH